MSEHYEELTVRPAKSNSLWTLKAKKVIRMLLTLLFTCLAFFSVYKFGLFNSTVHVRIMLSLNTCLITARVCRTLSEICTTSDAHLLMNPLEYCIRPGTQLQIKGCNQHIHKTPWNSVHWLPRYASTIIYCCIMLQQPYRGKQQSRKLWIAVSALSTGFTSHIVI
jgi:hypothetical protein